MATTVMSFTSAPESSSMLPPRPSSYDGIQPDTSLDDSLAFTEEDLRIYMLLTYGTLGHVIALFGIVTNVINIICLRRQGCDDSFNISLLGLAISDLGSLIFVIPVNMSCTPWIEEADLPFNSRQLQYGVHAWVYVSLTRITCCLIVYITIERCVCITMPFKVKTIFTPKRAKIIIACIFGILLISIAPMHYIYRLGWVFSPQRNRTILGLVYADERIIIEKYYFSIFNVFFPSATFAITMVCTIILVVRLRSQVQWRMQNAAIGREQNMSAREQRVAKMAVMISVLFIICYLPNCVLFLAMALEPEVSIYGKYKAWMRLGGGLTVTFQSFNSSVNIFIYYTMSVKYREIFWRLFGRGGQ